MHSLKGNSWLLSAGIMIKPQVIVLNTALSRMKHLFIKSSLMCPTVGSLSSKICFRITKHFFI